MKHGHLIHQPTVENERFTDNMLEACQVIGTVSKCLLALSISFGAHAQDQAKSQAAEAQPRISTSSNQPSQRLQAKAPGELTESQRILAKIMDDIRTCDKTVRYEYDSKTRSLNPPELKKIKGLKLKRLYREIAVFEINDRYEGLKARVLSIRRREASVNPPVHSVAFNDSFEVVRQRLESLWQLQFTDSLKPGPDVILDGQYAEIEMVVENKRRTLSVAKMPPDVYPHIAKPEVGCNHFEY